jgi:TPR repeat protein
VGCLPKNAVLSLELSNSGGSYAAFSSEAVFTEQSIPYRGATRNERLMLTRCIEMGYPAELAKAVTPVLSEFLKERELGCIRIHDLVAYLRSEINGNGEFSGEEDEVEPDDWDETLLDQEVFTEDLISSPMLLEGLESAASKGNAFAHYALALIHEDPDHEAPQGSEYWYLQEKAGRILSGVEKEWADAYAEDQVRSGKYIHHLKEAAKLGQPNALLDIADQFGDPTFFELGTENVIADPMEVAEIAARLERPNDAKRWLTIAAESGNIAAMRELIEGYDQDDLLRCWMWVYLAQHLGSDLTKDEHYAINEDGSDYDDDVGGPVYVDGRDGVDLKALGIEEDATARKAAKDLFALIQG